MITNGYIRLHRTMTEWEWYHDHNTLIVWIHLLMTVNWKDTKYEGVDVPRGSRVCSISTLASETGLSDRKIRTAISHLKSTSNVTSTSNTKFTVISIKNFDKYQTDDKVDDKRATSERQASDNILKKQKSSSYVVSSSACAHVREDLLEYVNESWGRAPTAYEARQLTEHMASLNASPDDDSDLLRTAIEASAEANRPLQYVLSILRRWKDAGIKTMTDYDKYMSARDARRNTPRREESIDKTYDLDDFFQAAVTRTHNKRKGN